MKVRADSVLVSSVLHTVALLFFVRAALWNYLAGSDRGSFAKLDSGFQAASETAHYLGVACLAIILIGLIVVWTGYLRRARYAWLVMFVIVCFWAFPLFMLPFVSALVHGRIVLSFSETLYDAISEWGIPRTVAESVLIFSLMVIALLLPIRRFFGDRAVERAIHRRSARLVGFCLTGALVVLSALYAWIRVGVVYEIPVTNLNMTDRLPPPPAPPNWDVRDGNSR